MSSSADPSVSMKGSGATGAGTPIVHGSMNWEPVRKRLLGSDLNDALKAASELREGIEIVHTTEFPLMLSALLPAFSSILAQRTRPSPDLTSTENKLRRTVLEIISRMPSNEVLRPHAPHLVALSIDILNRDYEDNALLASRVIFDLYKVYRSLPQDYVQPYLDYVISSYRSLPMAIQRNFALLPSSSPSPPSASATATATTPTTAPSTTENTGTTGDAIMTEASPTTQADQNTSTATATATASSKDEQATKPSPQASPPPKAPTATTSTAVATPGPSAEAALASSTTPSSETTLSPMSRGLAATPPRSRLALRAHLSFRCLCENPLLVMLKFQLYPNTLPRNIPVLVQVMMQALDQRPPSMQSLLVPPNTTMDAENRRHYFSKARELVAAQAKTLSFLTYLLRGFSDEIKPYEERLAANVVALMSTCPRESISTRKELLVATRHLLNSDFRTGFFGHVDKLLDERVLIGSSQRYSGQASLRPLAYTALSDLIHHVKAHLSMTQMSKVVCIFSRILHDSATLPLSTQYTAVRTLLSVIEIVFQNKDPNPQIGRDMLVRILSALVHKLSTIKEYLEVVKKNEGAFTAEEGSSDDRFDVEATILGRSYAQLASDHRDNCVVEKGDVKDKNVSYDGMADASNSWRDLRSMIRAIVVGHKTVIWYINNYRSQREKDKNRARQATAGTNEEVASAMLKMTNSERALVDKYILLAIPCMKFLKDGWSCGPDQAQRSLTPRKQVSSDQYRDVLSYFAAAFTTLDGYDLKRTLGKRLDVLVSAIIDDPAMMVIPRHLLSSNPTTSYEFCAILLRYLVERMDELSLSSSRDIIFIAAPRERDLREVESLNPQVEEALKSRAEATEKVENKASIYLQLFERVLKSLTLYSDNEAAVRPHLRLIVSTCLRSTMEDAEHWPDNYCMLLRFVFRSISAGKFEESYKELLPLIPAALNGLYRVLTATKCRIIRNTIVELCLTIPARLSSLLPHMNLLLRVIVEALSSNSADLVNLGLRTLEFWLGNLNNDYLFPEMSRQTLLFTQLMNALSQHLRPAPYPYGLLTLRLLGKLGGKNRRFLRELTDVCAEGSIEEAWRPSLSLKCTWVDASVSSQQEGERNSKQFPLPLPIKNCLEMLKRFAAIESTGEAADKKAPEGSSSGADSAGSESPLSWKDSAKLWEMKVEDVDFDYYCNDVSEQTRRSQALACFRVICTAIAAILHVGNFTVCSLKIPDDSDSRVIEDAEKMTDEETSYSRPGCNSYVAEAHNQELLCMSLGCMYSCIIDAIGEEAKAYLKGFASHIYYSVLCYHNCFQRIDAHGSKIDCEFGSKVDSGAQSESEGKNVEDERHGLLKPFGYFLPVGQLQETVNPLVFNEAVVEFLAAESPRSTEIGLGVIRHLLTLAKESEQGTDSAELPPFHNGALILFENLLSHLCGACFSHEWHRHEGLHEAICVMLEELGSAWGLKYEEEIMMVAFFVMKNVPRELSTTSIRAYKFFVKVCCRLYGRSNLMDGNHKNELIWDSLAVKGGKEAPKDKPASEPSKDKPASEPSTDKSAPEPSTDKSASEPPPKDEAMSEEPSSKDKEEPPPKDETMSEPPKDETMSEPPKDETMSEPPKDETMSEPPKEGKEPPNDNNTTAMHCPCPAVIQIALAELASPKQIVRIAARCLLKKFIPAEPKDTQAKVFSKHLSLIRRVIFSRSLRLLPLAEQVGAVEALAFVNEASSILPLKDSHQLAFLSELLKMSSVADGDMTDTALTGYVVDKNGKAAMGKKTSSQSGYKQEKSPSHASAIFRRRECILETEGLNFVVPEDLPDGIQLRVASISLLRAIIKGNADTFFEAEASTPIGNVRPHVVSLLFRSLVSTPVKAVVAAHEALQEALTLSIGQESQKSRLPKELLQTCIRPVLLNLREHTRLSVPLLRGLSRLLSLLSSWFNKTLGEKLLDHLQKWTQPDLIKSQKIWTPGEEPCVAAAIIDLFSLLPYASQFVEPLVKTTIKLEAYLPGFNAHFVGSPYRKPLARYLNKHCQYTVGFFFQRLKAPIYSELFQSIIRMEECVALRAYLSGRQCSVMMLNVCFERPLAIIRSEKTGASPSGTTSSVKSGSTSTPAAGLNMHGIQTDPVPPVHSESILKQDLEVKKKKLQALQLAFSKAKDSTQTAVPGSAEEEAKRQYKLAKGALDKGTRDLNEAKQRFAAEFAKSGSKLETGTTSSTLRPMNTESLELQHQGFALVEALIHKDPKYLQDHNDVVRALRWLWRSKGRYLRLQHEDMVSPRYHEESKTLVTFLMKYAKAFPNDVDVLFELIRIFLQPSTTDFSFVRFFLADTVRSLQLAQKKQLIQRFFALLAGESTEETKALSIQLLLLPLLSSTSTVAKETNPSQDNPPAEKQDKKIDAPVDETHELVDSAMMQKFTKEVLFEKGHPTNCGEKLKVELLRVTNAMLDLAPQQMKEHQKDIIRFCWTLIKSEDAICKAWAYVVVCHLISLFETQAKYVLQVYTALLRSHQQEGKSLVRKALALLVPALKNRLSSDDFKRSIESTSRIMFEDGSVPQLAHIWHTIQQHPKAFYGECQNFVRYMVNSLNRLGLPPNSSPENRALAVSIVDLLLEWDAERQTSESCQEENGTKLPQKRKAAGMENPPAKMSKDNSGLRVPASHDNALLDKSMMETIAHFLVRLKILLADPKVDSGVLNLNFRTMKTFRAVLCKRPNVLIRPIYFDKVVSLCKEEIALETSNLKEFEQSTGKGTKSPRSVSMKASLSPAEAKKSVIVTTEMLTACLDIFTALMDKAPDNQFLKDNGGLLKTILASCFRHISQSDGLQSQLRSFIEGLYRSRGTQIELSKDLLPFVNSLLEGLIAKPDDSNCSSSVSEQSRPPGSRGKEKSEASDGKDCDSQAIQFALAMIEDICKDRNDCFVVFTGALLSLGSRLTRKHLATISAKKRHGAAQTHQAGTSAIPQMYPTPTEGILDSIGAEESTPSTPGKAATSNSSRQASTTKYSTSPGSPLRSLVIVVRLFEARVPCTLSEDRKVLFRILSSILDNSDDVQLLMSSVKVIGGWLLSGGALTTRERQIFLHKITSSDIMNGLPDVGCQPLADLVALFVIKYLKDRQGPLSTSNPSCFKSKDDKSQKRLFSEDEIIRRAVVACLLNANAGIRNELLSIHESDALLSEHESSAEPRNLPDVLHHLLSSDYEGLGGRCWVVVFVEVLLKSCLWTGFDHQSHQMCLPPVIWDSTCNNREDETAKSILQFYESVAQTNSLAVNSGCLPSLQVLAHGDTGLCKDLFYALMPAAWKELPSDAARFEFVPSFESLLAQPFHSQMMKRSKGSASDTAPLNVVQLFLGAMEALQPRPLLDAYLLVSLAENYNCWYQVLGLLEQQYAILKANEVDPSVGKLVHVTLSAMRHCYRHLGDWDLWMSIAYDSCVVPDSRWALALDLYGMASEASDAYSLLVHSYQSDESKFPKVSDFELSMWEDRWVELQRELCQHSAVAEYANMSDNPNLMLESAWKAQDWDKVRLQLASPTVIAAMEAGDPTPKICDALLSVANGKLSDVENCHAQAAQLCLYRWQQLPRISRGSPSHTDLLHLFHRLVEIRESGQIMVETSNHSSGRTLPDLKTLLNTWRHRLPNNCENLTMWDDIFTWRTHMFSAITHNFHWSEPNTLATLHDKPWTAIRIAKTARKQGQRQVALQFLNQLTGNRSMDVNDAFYKLREQILVYDGAASDLERTGGLNLINTTNLSFFDSAQKSELFRLKAVFLASLGLRSKSNQAFCHAVQVCPSHARAWVSWGGLCSHLGALTEKQMEQTAAKSGTEPSKETRANTAKKVAQYLAQSMGCYFEAVQLTTEDWARMHLPKCLLMLVKDGASPGVLCQTLENRGGELPAWVWLPWMPYLLSSLCRIEGRAAKAILVKLVKLYPQAIYYALRSFYLERRDVDRAKGTPTPGGHMGSVSHAEDMMSTLRRSHASLWSSLESILEELIVKFRPSFEEELLSTITALIERADSQGGTSSSTDSSKGDDNDTTMLASVAKTIGRIAVKFFKPASDGGSNRNDERAKKTAEFKAMYKEQFENDFKVSSSDTTESVEKGALLSLEEYLTLLKRWRRKLELQVALTPLALPLIESSRALSLFAADSPDLWPGACDTSASTNYQGRSRSHFETESRTSQSTTSSSAVAAKKAAAIAASAVMTASAKEGVGGHFGGGSSCVEIPGQYPPNAACSEKPSPELHPKLVCFGATVNVLRREQLYRRVSLVGSDGRVYRFLLQFAIPYWTRTDERVAQTHFVLDKLLRKDWRSERRHLSVEPTAVIPVAQRLRMTADSTSRTSLDEIYKRKCMKDGKDPNAVVDFFNREVAKARNNEDQENRDTSAKNSVRSEVLSKAAKRTGTLLMIRHVSAALGSPEAVFNFRRSFSDQFATNSLLQHVFAVVERTPQRVVFTLSNGRVQAPDFRVSYNSQGFIESRSIPFRMTPNLRAFIGLPFLNGRFASTISTVADAVKQSKEEVDPIWRLLMRDDIVAWYCKSMAKSDSKLQELEKQLADRVAKNVYYMQMRFSECSLPEVEVKADTAREPIDKKVRDLIKIATDPEKLCTMPASYQAWL